VFRNVSVTTRPLWFPSASVDGPGAVRNISVNRGEKASSVTTPGLCTSPPAVRSAEALKVAVCELELTGTDVTYSSVPLPVAVNRYTPCPGPGVVKVCTSDSSVSVPSPETAR
jgi:hypothetical protein